MASTRGHSPAETSRMSSNWPLSNASPTKPTTRSAAKPVKIRSIAMPKARASDSWSIEGRGSTFPMFDSRLNNLAMPTLPILLMKLWSRKMFLRLRSPCEIFSGREWRNNNADATSKQILNLTYHGKGGAPLLRLRCCPRLRFDMYSYTMEVLLGQAPNIITMCGWWMRLKRPTYKFPSKTNIKVLPKLTPTLKLVPPFYFQLFN